MDILTIHPFTSFLRDLKLEGVLNPNKLRIVINEEKKVDSITTTEIIRDLSCYTSPSMSVMTELFNKDTIKSYIIPFDVDAYSKYLEMVLECEINVSTYSRTIHA